MPNLTTSDGIELSYLRQGTGRPLVILHGWCSNALEWLPCAEALAARFKVVCWNARGHGRQPHAADIDTRLERMADDLAELLAREAPGGAVLVGHSMGALTAWAYIRKYGCGALDGLCILDQTPKLLTGDAWALGIYGDFDADRNRRFVAAQQAHFAEAVGRLICTDPDTPLPETPYARRLYDYLAALPAPLLTRCWQSLSDADLRPVLPRIDVPTLLIYGDRSQFYGPAVARWVQGQIPDSRLVRYPEADHSPHLKEKDRFLSDLSRFALGLGRVREARA